MMIDSGTLLEIFLWLSTIGILLAPVVPQRWNPLVLAWVASLAAACILGAAGQALFAGSNFETELWSLPSLGTLRLGLDRLSALFLLVTGLVFLPTSIFSAGYLKRYLRRYSLKTFSVWYLGLFTSIVLILVAQDVLSFLLACELMSIFSYLLVNYEHQQESHTRAGYLMLAMGEAGTLAAAVALLILANTAGSLEFSALKAAAGTVGMGTRWAVFLLSFFGFGVKAGLVPLNSWLPRAHPAAPANVSALLSGVILNLGIYGIVRVNIDLLPVVSIEAGLVALGIGSISAFVGILYATTENDLKGMLAHSSIENMGIITAGLGGGLIFAASGLPSLAGIAFLAAFYHMTNHSLYKALLFLGAGTVDYRVGTRDLDRLGGLIRRMPWTALFFLLGALSISALPPFNGFVSEWLTLQALLRSAELTSTPVKIAFALCGVALALTAALAVTCFVKAFALGFLGMARSKRARRAVEARQSMLVPMGFLAALCLLLGVLPTYVIPMLDETLAPMTGAGATDALMPPFFATSPGHAELPSEFTAEFHDLGAQIGQEVMPGRGLVVLHRGGTENPVVFAMSTTYGFVVLVLLLAITTGVTRWLTRGRRLTRGARWDGGLRRLLPEMTYTATGFSNPVRVVFDAIFRPKTVEDTKETVAEHFHTAVRRSREDVHLVDRLVFGVIAEGTGTLARLLARMHHGRVNSYVAYVLAILVIFLIIGGLQ
jgi:hydrogenase-4 component B